jgi:hypothetical protein
MEGVFVRFSFFPSEGDFPYEIDPVNVDYADVARIKLLQFQLL